MPAGTDGRASPPATEIPYTLSGNARKSETQISIRGWRPLTCHHACITSGACVACDGPFSLRSLLNERTRPAAAIPYAQLLPAMAGVCARDGRGVRRRVARGRSGPVDGANRPALRTRTAACAVRHAGRRAARGQCGLGPLRLGPVRVGGIHRPCADPARGGAVERRAEWRRVERWVLQGVYEGWFQQLGMLAGLAVQSVPSDTVDLRRLVLARTA